MRGGTLGEKWVYNFKELSVTSLEGWGIPIFMGDCWREGDWGLSDLTIVEFLVELGTEKVSLYLTLDNGVCICILL